MPRAAVLGHPVAHSLSPALHSAAYAALGLPDWRYLAIDCETGALLDLLERASLSHETADKWVGFSCTMPLKRVALELASRADPIASAVGAANTLLPDGTGWRAAMTDVSGILAALAERGVDPSEVTVLGSGGTAQAAIGALAELGIGACTVLVRDLGHTAELMASAERLGVAVRLGGLDALAGSLAADLVISTLPPGAADPLAERTWRSGQALLDVAYDPWPTILAAAAERGGATVVSGALMLLHQAAAQVALMTGRDAPVSAMRAALRAVAPYCGV